MYENFVTWLEGIFPDDIPENAIAINFNLYEDGDNLWSVELVATDVFDPKDNDWACEEVFAARENPFEWEEEIQWQDVLENACEWVKTYMNNGTYAKELKNYDGIGVGFVDGDIEILHIKA